MIVLGIDPGLKGALAIFVRGQLSEIQDMPVTPDGLDAHGLLLMLRASGADAIYVEAVGPRPTDGAVQAFTFGACYGGIRTVVELYRIERLRGVRWVSVSLVTPSTWTRSLGLAHTDKQARKALCKESWPAHARLFRRGDHADAALIGSYGVAQEGQQKEA